MTIEDVAQAPQATPAEGVETPATTDAPADPSLQTQAEGAPAPEPPAEAKPSLSEEDYQARIKSLSSGFAALSRKEKAVREREAKIKEAEEVLQRHKTLASRFKESPGHVLDELAKDAGVDRPGYEYATDWYVRDGKPNPEDLVKTSLSKAEQLEAKIREMEEKIEAEKLQAQRQAWLDGYKSQISQVISTEPDKYPLLNGLGRHELVTDVAGYLYNEIDGVPAAQKAVEAAENYLRDEAVSTLEQLLAIPAMQEKAKAFLSGNSEQPGTQPQPIEQAPQARATGAAQQTLTSRLASTRSPRGDLPPIEVKSVAQLKEEQFKRVLAMMEAQG